MLKKIALFIVVVLASVFIAAAFRPNSFRVQRTATMHASADRIFAFITDFRTWPVWSPYEAIDPGMKRKYSGAERGPGAVYEWEGQGKAGAGRMEIVDVTPSSKVTIKLDFVKPFVSHNTAEYTLESHGDTTTVTWAMFGPSPYVTKLVGMFFSMDSLVGEDFETGLANLKTVSEQ